MSKTIMCKGCGAEISKKIKKCPQCGKRNKKHIGLIIVAIIILLIIIATISSSIEEAKEKRVKYSWPSMGIATLLPQPESEYGKIGSESDTYFSIDIYNISLDDFNEYVNQCKENGFLVDYHSTSSSYYADDENGNSLSVYFYDKKDEMNIYISAYKEEIETNNELEDTNEEAVVNEDEVEIQDYTSLEELEIEEKAEMKNNKENNTEFREWVDSYEGFMNEYVDFMKKYSESDGTDLTLLVDYTSFMTKYSEFMNESEEVDEENLSAEDYIYYLDAQTRVLNKLSEIQ